MNEIMPREPLFTPRQAPGSAERPRKPRATRKRGVIPRQQEINKELPIGS